jgi:hypothetical protein
MKPKLKLPGTKRLKLECDGLLSDFGFKFNLRRYTKGYESMWQKADGTDNVNADGAWVCEPPNCMVLKQVQDEATGEMTEFYIIDPNLEAGAYTRPLFGST